MHHSMMFTGTARPMGTIAKVIALGLLLSLSSCSIPALRSGQPGPPIPEDFNGMSSQENSAKLTVEEFYEDPVLTQMVGQALAGNQELKQLEEEIQIAANQIRARQGAFLPFLSLRGKSGLDRPSLYTPIGAAEDQLTAPGGRGFPDPMGQFGIVANLFWRIDYLRQYRNLRDAAIQRYLASIDNRNSFVTQMVATVAENYYELMALDQQLQNLSRIIGLQQQSLEFAEARKEGGRATALAVERFRAAVRGNQSQQEIVLQAIIITENRVNFTLGRFPQPVERDSENFLDMNLRAPRVGLPSELLLYRPDIRQAERELVANGLEVRSTRARFFPSINLTGDVGYAAFNPRYLFLPDALVGQVAGNLMQPLINKLAIQADYLSANASQLRALYNYQRTILNAFTEVVNNLARAERFRRAVELKKQQLAALESAVGAATDLFQAARANYLDVLFAQNALRQARLELIDTKQQELTAIVNVYRALGGGTLLSTPSPNPEQAETDAAPFVPPLPAEPKPAVPAEPKPAVPAEPKPAVPAERNPAVSADLKPVVPAEPKPAVSADLKPVVPAKPKPVVPAKPKPAAPDELKPSVPTDPPRPKPSREDTKNE